MAVAMLSFDSHLNRRAHIRYADNGQNGHHQPDLHEVVHFLSLAEHAADFITDIDADLFEDQPRRGRPTFVNGLLSVLSVNQNNLLQLQHLSRLMR